MVPPAGALNGKGRIPGSRPPHGGGQVLNTAAGDDIGITGELSAQEATQNQILTYATQFEKKIAG